MPYNISGSWTNTGKNTLETQEALNASMGYGTTPVYLAAGESDTTNTFFALQMLNDAVLTAVTGSGATSISNITGITLPAGMAVYGEFSVITVTSGVICYYK